MKELLYLIIDGIAYALSKLIEFFKKDSHTNEVRRNTHLDGRLYDIVERYDLDRALVIQIKNGDVFFSGIHQHKLVATNEHTAEDVLEIADHFTEISATMLRQQIKETIALGFSHGAVEDLKRNRIKETLEVVTMMSIGVRNFGMIPIKHPSGGYTIGYLWLHSLSDKKVTSQMCLELKEDAAWFAGYLTKSYGRQFRKRSR